MTTQQKKVYVFLSYAAKDQEWADELLNHLVSLQQKGIISIWHHQMIDAGADRSKTIDQQLKVASLILLLVSSDFLASDDNNEVVKQALERSTSGQARVIPIRVRPVVWDDTPFAHLKALPTNDKVISKMNKDEALVEVVSGIRQTIDALSSRSVGAPGTAQPSIWNIPYPRNPFFLGRNDLLVRLHTHLQTGQATALSQSPYAMSGLGGIGKTQIAVEYAYRHRQEYQAVLWTRADTNEALMSGYVAIAGLLNLPLKEGKEQTIIVQDVVQWLKTNSQWLLILDNADELSVVREFLPPVFGGHIVLTTRAQTMGKRAQLIQVEAMDQDTGALLLLRRASLLAKEASLEQATAAERTLAGAISEDLGGLPLALDQAGAYLDETGCSLAAYQRSFRATRAKLLKRRGGDGQEDDHPDPVETTWKLSFEQVEQRSPAAADLLRVCAFLAPDSIPEEIITTGASSLGERLQSLGEEQGELEFNEVIRILRAYSLIQREGENKVLSVHRLVQAVQQDALKEEEQRTWAERAMQAINATFPDSEHGTWPMCERLLTQALMAAYWIEHYHFTNEEAASLLYKSATYLQDRARYSEAEPLYQRALHIWEQRLGPEHPLVASPLNGLAHLCKMQGKYAEAEPLYQRALHIWEQSLGPEHPLVASPLNGLANLCVEQGKYAEAEPFYQRALHIREQSLGPEHPLVASPLTNLAHLYAEQGKYAEAELLYQRALHIREQSLGPEHSLVASPLTGLAFLYAEQGKYTEVELLYQRALHIREQSLGPEHPEVTYPLTGLANLYAEQGKYVEAELLYQRALHIREQSLGPEHSLIRQTRRNYALLLQKMGRDAEAQKLEEGSNTV